MFKLAHFDVYLGAPDVLEWYALFCINLTSVLKMALPSTGLSQSYLVFFVYEQLLSRVPSVPLEWIKSKWLSHILFSEIIYRRVFEVMLLSNVFKFIILPYYVLLYLKASSNKILILCVDGLLMRRWHAQRVLCFGLVATYVGRMKSLRN